MSFFNKNKAVPKKNEGPTRITILYNAGFPNNLFIRGKGGGLSWDRGIPLKNIGAGEWVWETHTPCGECEFKVLINDQKYEAGENHHLRDGTQLKYTPKF